MTEALKVGASFYLCTYMANFDFEIFNGKSFKDLCKDVIERSESKKDQLDTLVSDIRSLIKGPNDAQAFMPRIKELLEVGVKNDEQIIKLASVIQRLQSTQLEASGGEFGGLSEEDKDQLMQARIRELEVLKDINKQVTEPVPIMDTTSSL
jgi:hypothetical protein